MYNYTHICFGPHPKKHMYILKDTRTHTKKLTHRKMKLLSWKYIHRTLLQTLHKRDTGERKLSEFL